MCVCARASVHITKTKAPRHDARVPRRGDQNVDGGVLRLKLYENQNVQQMFIIVFCSNVILKFETAKYTMYPVMHVLLCNYSRNIR